MTTIKKFFIYAGIFIAGFALISLWNFYSIIRPPKIDTRLTPSNFNLPAQDVIIKTEDGLNLSAWFVEPPEKSSDGRALIILHGYPAEKSDMLSIASSLYPEFALLLLDLRYFGKSEGVYTTFGVRERHDIASAADFLESRGYGKIGIFGFSLGGAIGILAAAEDKRIKAVASYASFSDLRTIGEDAYAGLWILKKPMVKLMLWWPQLLFKESPTEISPARAAKNLNIPVFLIHSTGDEQIPFSHALRIKEALPENPKNEFYFPEKRLHGDLPPEFHTKLKEFFNKSL